MPIQWAVVTPPIPSQFVNDRPIEATVGNQTSPPTRMTGTVIITAIAMRSRMESRTARPLRGVPSGCSAVATPEVIASVGDCSRSEDRDLLLLDAAAEPIDVVGIVEERLDRRDHDGRREVGSRVAV